MDLQPNPFDAAKEGQQGVIWGDWRCPPLRSISWSYFNQVGAKCRHPKPPHYHESLFLASFAEQSIPSLEFGSVSSIEAKVLLSPDLPGVLGVEDVLAPYEAAVGFHYCSDILDLQYIAEGKNDLSIEVGEDQVAYSKQCWDGLVEKLFSGLMDLHEELGGYVGVDGRSDGSSRSSSAGGLHHSTSTQFSFESTDSDLSVNSSSVPSTPKAKSAEVDVEVASASPTSSIYYSTVSSPTRPLNASASSFVPSFNKPPMDPIPFPSLVHPNAPSPPTTFVNFTFPSLDISSPPVVKIRKDEQGFYSEVEASSPAPPPSRPSSALLPLFLQERRKAPVSKTRAMVERLRSSNQSQDVFGTDISTSSWTHSASHSPTPSPPLYNLEFLKERLAASDDGRGRNSGVSSPATTLDEDEDGWINIAEEQLTEEESKARRTRNLFLALTRRRSDSMPPRKPQLSEESGDNIAETTIPATCSSSPSPSPLSCSNDGWIEGPASGPKPTGRSRTGRKHRSSNIPAPLPTIPHFALPPTARPPGATHLTHAPYSPAPYFYAVYPPMMSPMPYASYMQMQFQMQQMQMRGHEASTPSGEWFPYPNTAQPGVAPPPPFPNMNPQPPSMMGNGLLW